MTAAAGFRIAAMGDIMMARGVGRHYAEAPRDFALDDVRRVLEDADLVCANLENPVALGGAPCAGQDPNVTFRAHPATLDVLRTLRVSVVSLGNNHMLDYGEPALAETLEHLDAAGIRHVGAGRNYEEANRPLVIEAGGRKLAFLSFAFIYSVNTRMASRGRPGVSDHRLSRIVSQVRSLRGSGCDVVVMSHWGHEYRFYPVPYQMRAARRIVEAGACLVLGHGPHYPQGIEQHNGAPIVYSLGNFIFDEPHKYANRSFIYRGEISADGSARTCDVVPVHLRRHVPVVVDGPERRRLLNLLDALGRRYRSKDARFWREVSGDYLTDVCGRVIRGRSAKYLLVPELSLFADAGPKAILRKMRPSAVLGLTRAMSHR